jgi:hypothetical protein
VTHVRELAKLFILGGSAATAAGLLPSSFADRLPWIGRLPGDFSLRRGRLAVWFPPAARRLVSVLLAVAPSGWSGR